MLVLMLNNYTKLFKHLILHGNIDQTLKNSMHGLLNFEIGGLDCLVITLEYISRVH